MLKLAEKPYIDALSKGRNSWAKAVFSALMDEMVTLGNVNDAEVLVLFLKIGEEKSRRL